MLVQRPSLRHVISSIGPALVCVVLPLILVLSTIDRHPKFSPIDEAAHFDYVERVLTHGVPKFGDRLLKTTLGELSCRGTRLDGLVVPACDAKKPYDLYPGGAFQYEAQQPPLYYAFTAVPAKLLKRAVGIGSVGSARVIGILWLAAGLLVLWAASRELGIARLPMLATILAITAAPNVVYYSSIISNDAAGILCGSLVVYLAALAYARQRPCLWWALGLGVAVSLVKTSCALPAGVVGLVLFVGAWLMKAASEGGIKESTDALRKTGLGLILGSVGGTLLWVISYRALATIDPKRLPTFDVLRTGPVTPANILGQAKTFLAMLTDAYNPFNIWNGEIYGLLATLAMLVLVAGLAAGAFSTTRTWWTVIGPSVLALLYLGGVAIGVGIWRAYDINPGVSGRYALPMLPLVAVIISAGLQRKAAQWVYSAGCVCFAALSIWMITHVSLA